ncbi:MAG: iron-containing alcohol dehydrogenase [Bacillus sp. (in: firmicutes)]
MNNFVFHNPVRIIFGQNQLPELQKYVPANARVLILYGGGSAKKYGTLQQATQNLPTQTIFEFGGIEPNPKYTTLMKAVEIVKNENIDFLLAVGGGSVMDGTKFIALAAKYDGDAADILFNKSVVIPQLKEAVPFGTIVTLPATGSEMNSGGVISIEHRKLSFGSPLVYPQFSIVDPSLSFTLPARQIANGIIDAFVHVVEQYVTFPQNAMVQDRYAEALLLTLIEVGPITLNNPTDYDARANLTWAATNALNGTINKGVVTDWSTHALGHELTARFGLDHAVTLAIVLPSLWRVLKEQKHDKLVQYAERVWSISEGSEEEKIEAAIQQTQTFFESLGVSTKLSSYGVKREEIEDVVTALEEQGFTKLSETGKLTPSVAREILNLSYE